VNVTAWASGLEVTGDGTGIVLHAGGGLLRRLSDKTGLTGGLSRALFSGRLVHHDGAGYWPTSRARSRTVPARSVISGCWPTRRGGGASPKPARVGGSVENGCEHERADRDTQGSHSGARPRGRCHSMPPSVRTWTPV
jgi:hypothetical protein